MGESWPLGVKGACWAGPGDGGLGSNSLGPHPGAGGPVPLPLGLCWVHVFEVEEGASEGLTAALVSPKDSSRKAGGVAGQIPSQLSPTPGAQWEGEGTGPLEALGARVRTRRPEARAMETEAGPAGDGAHPTLTPSRLFLEPNGSPSAKGHSDSWDSPDPGNLGDPQAPSHEGSKGRGTPWWGAYPPAQGSPLQQQRWRHR